MFESLLEVDEQIIIFMIRMTLQDLQTESPKQDMLQEAIMQEH
jgi:hypothetical protein